MTVEEQVVIESSPSSVRQAAKLLEGAAAADKQAKPLPNGAVPAKITRQSSGSLAARQAIFLDGSSTPAPAAVAAPAKPAKALPREAAASAPKPPSSLANGTTAAGSTAAATDPAPTPAPVSALPHQNGRPKVKKQVSFKAENETREFRVTDPSSGPEPEDLDATSSDDQAEEVAKPGEIPSPMPKSAAAAAATAEVDKGPMEASEESPAVPKHASVASSEVDAVSEPVNGTTEAASSSEAPAAAEDDGMPEVEEAKAAPAEPEEAAEAEEEEEEEEDDYEPSLEEEQKLKQVRELLAGPEGPDPLRLASELLAAAGRGQVAVVKALLDGGASVDHTDNVGWTALHEAASEGQPAVVDTLLRRGASVNMAHLFVGWTPLYMAASRGNLAVVAALLDAGADINRSDLVGCTALHAAAVQGHSRVVAALLEREADPDMTGEDGRTPLHFAAEKGHAEVAAALLGNGAATSIADEAGDTPLHLAAARGHLSIVHALLFRGADVRVANAARLAPLHLAAQRGAVDIVTALLDAEAPINAQGRDGYTALHEAVIGGHGGLVELLLSRRADPGIADSVVGWTPLHAAVAGARMGILRALLAAGANANVADREGYTPLHYAAALGWVGVVELLLGKLDTDVDRASGKPTQMLLVAAGEKGCDERAAKLWRKAAVVDTRGGPEPPGQTPLHLAAGRNHMEVVNCLLASEARIAARDRRGRTPAEVAVQRGHTGVGQRLTDLVLLHRTVSGRDLDRFAVEAAAFKSAKDDEEERLMRLAEQVEGTSLHRTMSDFNRMG